MHNLCFVRHAKILDHSVLREDVRILQKLGVVVGLFGGILVTMNSATSQCDCCLVVSYMMLVV